MSVKPEYSKYSRRLFQGLLGASIPLIIWIIMLLIYGIWNVTEITIISSFIITYSLILILYRIKKSKIYLTEFRVEGDLFIIETNKFDKPNETIKSQISATRVKIYETFFPFSRFSRSYKLIIETKQGLKYERIIQQPEIANWTLDKFKEVIKVYGEAKGISTSTTSFS